MEDPGKRSAEGADTSLRAVLDRISDGIVALDRDWRYVYANQRAAEMLQRRRPADLIGRHIWTEYPEGIGQPFQRAYERALATQQPVFLEEHYAPWDRWFENRIYPSPEGLSIYFTDITERKREEAGLRMLEERYRLLFESNPQPSWVYDLETLAFLAVNDAAVEHYGYSRAEFLAMTIADIRPREDLPRLLRNVAQVSAGIDHAGHWRHRRKDGSLIDVEITSHTLTIDGRPAELVLANDITQRLQAERALRESEAGFRHFFDAGLVGMAITVPTKGWGRFNDRLCEMLGYTQQQLAGMTWAEVTHPDDLAADVAQFERVLAGETDGYSMDKRFLRRDGSLLHASIAVRAERDAQGGVERFFAIVEDINARKQAEEALRVKEAALESALSGIALADPDGRLNYVNRAFCSLWRAGEDEVLGTPATTYWADPGRARQVIEAIAAHGHWSGEMRARRLDGTEFDAQLMASLVRDAAGRPLCMMASFVDVTDSRRARETLARSRDELDALVQERTRELVAARDQAQQASRAKSEFLSRMSHELRTPLNAIIGFSQLLEIAPSLDGRLRGYAQETLRAGRHLLALINDVLDLAQIESGRVTLSPEALALPELAEDCLRMVGPAAASRRIALTARGLAGLAVRADRTRLRQVLLNLLSNAIKYNVDGGTVTIEAVPTADARLRVTIVDTGPGIAPALQPRLFEPFNRLGAESGPVEGTGIGLSIARQLIEMMGGAIGVDSRPGAGSRFWVELPAATAGAPQPAPSAPAAVQSATTAMPSALYVEDNEANRVLVQQVIALRRPDIRLLTAVTAGEGLELARAQRPDLLLLDLQLPDMDGYQLLARLRADPLTRAIPAVAVTAFAMPDDAQRTRAAGFDDYVAKPMDLVRFEALLGRLLPARG